MACGVTGAGAAGSVDGGAGAAAGVCANPAVVINPAPSAEIRTKLRFIRSVVLLQEIVTTQISFVCASIASAMPQASEACMQVLIVAEKITANRCSLTAWALAVSQVLSSSDADALPMAPKAQQAPQLPKRHCRHPQWPARCRSCPAASRA